QGIGIRSHRIAAPNELARLDIVSCDRAANAKFAPGNADKNLVLDDHWRRSARLPLGRVAILHGPNDRTGMCVERDQRRVGLILENLAFGIRNTARNRIAAHHRNDVWILFGFVLPDNLAVVIQVERVDGVREWRIEIHHTADHQRPALMAAQNSGRKSPDWSETIDIPSIDLIELRVTLIEVVASRHDPLFWVF